MDICIIENKDLLVVQLIMGNPNLPYYLVYIQVKRRNSIGAS